MNHAVMRMNDKPGRIVRVYQMSLE